VDFDQTTRCHNPEDSILHSHRREIPNSNTAEFGFAIEVTAVTIRTICFAAKANLPLCLIKHYAMETYEVVDV
jgi:hypothetical protein